MKRPRGQKRIKVQQLSALLFAILFLAPAAVFAFGTDGAPTVFNFSVFTSADATPHVDGATGAFTQHVPLDIPPGRNGLQSDLSLDYSSQRTQDSIVGYGWSLSIPYIQRLNKTGSQNLYSASQPYFASSIDGELATSTTSVYRARVDDGSFRSYSYSTSTDTWTVYDKSGTRYQYGASSQSRQATTSPTETYKWMLEEVRDTNDNYVKYTYLKDSGEIYPYKITYTGHGSTDGPFTITFATSSRPDTRVSYAPGFKVTTNYRISEIDASVSGSIVRKYLLTYGTGNNGTRSLLTGIQQEGYDDNNTLTTLPAMSFTYSNSPVQFYTAGAGLENVVYGSAWPVADSDGNGINDVNFFSYSNSDGFASAQIGLNQTGTANLTHVPGYWSNIANNLPAERGERYLDVNADGKADLIQGFLAPGGTTTQEFLNTYSTSTPIAWATSTAYSGVIPDFGFTDNTYTITTGLFADVNGDGLPDFESWQGATTSIPKSAYLGNGSAFDATTTAFVPAQTISGTSPSPTASQLIDINGDGLDDWIYSDGTNTYVLLNNGSGWDTATTSSPWTIATSTLFKSPDPGTNVEYDRGIRFMDVNGDGLPDFVRSYDMTNNAVCTGVAHGEIATANFVMLNTGNGWAAPTSTLYSLSGNTIVRQTGVGPCPPGGSNWNGSFAENEYSNWYGNGQMQQDVISKVTYSKGGSTDVSYKLTTQTGANPALPFALLTVSTLINHDNRGSNEETDYTYSGGEQYLPSFVPDRKFGGFATTTASTADTITTTYFNQGNGTSTSLGEQSDGYAQINHPYRIDVSTPAGVLVQKTYNRWDIVGHGNSVFVGLGRQVIERFASDGTHRDTATEYKYSSTNDDLTETDNWGEVTGNADGTFSDISGDSRTTYLTYAASSSVNMSLPVEKRTIDNSSATSTDSKFYYDSLAFGSVNIGNQTREEDWITGSTYASTTKAYNAYGLVATSTDADGNATAYAYDSLNVYPATTTNALSQSNAFTYNYSNGKVKQTTDPNGGITKNVYDGVGRLTEADQSDPASPASLQIKTTLQYTDSTSTPPSIHRADYLNAATTTDAYQYFDGLNRLIQTRKQSETSGTYAVSDTGYTTTGKTASTSLPYFASGSSFASATTTPALFTTFTYDPLGRTLTAANIVGTTTNTYTKWTTTTTDPNGHKKDAIADAYGNLAQVVEYGGSIGTTTYTYNAANNLTKLTDASGNIRNFTYDGLGRRLTAEDLHTTGAGSFGTWSYTYDPAENLTQKLDAKSQTINYTYDALNRPLTEDYTGSTGTDVSYTYDSCTKGIGRLCTASSTSALNSYAYDVLGRTTIATTTVGGVAYPTTYSYDRQGNITALTYPNSDQAAFTYNLAGLPETATRANAGSSFANIVSDFDYAPTGAESQKIFGNAATTTLTYDAGALYRLIGLQTLSTSTSVTTVSGTSSLPTPVSYWKFDESSGNASDSVGTNTLTAVNTPTYGAAKINNGVQLVRSSSQRMSIADGSQSGLGFTGDFTVAGWVKFSSMPIGTDQGLIGKFNPPVHQQSYEVNFHDNNDGTVMFEAGLSSNGTSQYFNGVNTTFSAGTWYHVAAVYTASLGKFEFFVNGSSIGSATGYPSSIYNSTADVYVGDYNGSAYFNGTMDEMGVWSSALSGSQIAELYNGSSGRSYPFGGSSATTTTTTTALVQNLGYTYDKVGNIIGLTDYSTTTAARSVSYSYDNLNRLTAASTNAASSSPYYQTYGYDPLGNITSWSFSTTSGSIPGPAHFWKLDESSGTAGDTVGSDTLTNENSTAFAAGKIGNGASLVTANFNRFSILDANQTGLNLSGDFTVSAWVKFTTLPSTAADDGLIGKWQPNTNEAYELDFHNNNDGTYKIEAGLSSSGGSPVFKGVPITLATGTWYHIVVVYTASSGKVEFFQNGTSLGSQTGFPTSLFHNTATFYLGDYNGGAYFNGMLDEVGLWTQPLSSSNISTLYNSGNGIAYPFVIGTNSTYTYGGTGYPNPDAVTQIGNGTATSTYSYDNDGNLTQIVQGATTTTYVWDYANRLIALGINGATSTYGYDYQGNRVLQVSAGATTTYPSKWYSRALTGSAATSTEYVFSPGASGELLATIDGTGSATTTHYVHPDHLGSTNVITDQNLAASEVVDYYPYGAQRIDANSSGITEGRKYIGQFNDVSGLSYLNARYYNPSQGQFLTEDPVFLGEPKLQNISDPQSLNVYSYSEDNPIVKSDPSGKCIEDGCALETLATVGAIAGVGSRYIGDVMENHANGIAGPQAYLPRSSLSQYALAAGTGAAATAATAYSMGLAALISAGGYATDNQLAGKPFNLGNTLAVGALSYLTGNFFEWGVGPVPMSLLLKKIVVGGTFDTSSQAILQNALGAAGYPSGSLRSLPSTVTQGAATYYRNSSGLLSSSPQSPGNSKNGGYGSAGTVYTDFVPANTHTACGTLCK